MPQMGKGKGAGGKSSTNGGSAKLPKGSVQNVGGGGKMKKPKSSTGY